MDIEEIIESSVLEDEELEFKSTDDRPEKILKELVSLANTRGGTLIIGIREEDGEIIEIEDYNESDHSPSGLEEWLNNSIHDRVEPTLHFDYKVVEYEGKDLIQIDIEDDDYLYSIEFNGKPSFPYRTGSSISYLHGYDLMGRHQPTGAVSPSESRYETNSHPQQAARSEISTRDPMWSGGTYATGTAELPTSIESPNYSAPANRLVVETGGHHITTFGEIGIEPFKSPKSTVRLRDTVDIYDIEDLQYGFEQLDAKLDLGTYRSPAYGIKYGSRQLIGRGVQNFLEDATNIRQICNQLLPGSDTVGSSPRPIGVIAFTLPEGVCLLEFQWDGDSFRPGRSSLQILLENIPLNPTPYRDLFDSLGANPLSFEEQTRLQVIRISSRAELYNTGIVDFRPDRSRAHNEVVAANPFYNSSELIQSAFEIEIPRHFTEMLAGVNRISFDVAGGWHPEDSAFDFSQIEVLQLDGLLDTFIINGLSRATETGADTEVIDSVPEIIDP